MMEGRLEGKVAWVTGSSRGIGRVVASHLVHLGASVVVCGTGPYSIRAFGEADSLEAVAEAIAKEHNVETLAVWGDLSGEATVKGAGDRRFGAIDILVNCAGGDIGAQGVMGPNAGKPQHNDPVHVSLEDIRAVLDRNLMTCILVCREVAPEMIERKSGWIVNVGGVAGLAGRSTEAIYCTAKAAVHEYSRCLADLLRPHNVHVNVVSPGPVVGRQSQHIGPSGGEIGRRVHRVSVGRGHHSRPSRSRRHDRDIQTGSSWSFHCGHTPVQTESTLACHVGIWAGFCPNLS
jgi:3-oxoacyl-[acyl-carrier protein] reductase